jgi:WD40 repeat protein
MFGAALLAAASCSTQSPPQSQPAPRRPFEFIGEWGVKGDGPGQLSRPSGIATDFTGNVYVSDSGSGFIHKFDPNGRPLLSFEDGVPPNAGGIAVDRGGGIYVIANGLDSVFIFFPQGERFRELRLMPRLPHQWPASLAVGPDGSIFVIEVSGDTLRRELRKYSSRGRLQKSWKPQPDSLGEFLSPAALAAGLDGYLYLVDLTGHRTQKYTEDGQFVSGWGTAERLSRSSRSSVRRVGAALAVTNAYVFAVDSENGGVRVWTLDGQEKVTDNLDGRLPPDVGAFEIAVSPRHELLVLDGTAARLLRFRINF